MREELCKIAKWFTLQTSESGAEYKKALIEVDVALEFVEQKIKEARIDELKKLLKDENFIWDEIVENRIKELEA